MACRCCAASALQSLRGMLTICLFPTQLFVQTIKQRHRFKALCYVLLGISLSDVLNNVMLASFEITSQSLHFIEFYTKLTNANFILSYHILFI